jgi:hypothetical protein
MRPATDLILRGAASQIARAETRLSPIDSENYLSSQIVARSWFT